MADAFIVMKRGLTSGAMILLFAAVGCGAASEQVGRWFYRDGSPVPDGTGRSRLVLNVELGPEHCDWDRTLFMWMAWPLDRPLHGFSSGGKDRLRTYIWQEEDGGFYEGKLLSKPGVVSSLPNDVRDTGLHRGDWHLLISPSMEDRAVFVTNGLTTQVWARAESPPGCA